MSAKPHMRWQKPFWIAMAIISFWINESSGNNLQRAATAQFRKHFHWLAVYHILTTMADLVSGLFHDLDVNVLFILMIDKENPTCRDHLDHDKDNTFLAPLDPFPILLHFFVVVNWDDCQNQRQRQGLIKKMDNSLVQALCSIHSDLKYIEGSSIEK